MKYYCPKCKKVYFEHELIVLNLLPICECGRDLLQGEPVKIQMGLFQEGRLIEPILNAIDINPANVVVMNAMAGLLDRQYQEIKERDGVDDKSYIAFDYTNKLA